MGRRSARGAPGWGVGTWLQLLDLAPHWPGAGPAPSHPLQQLLAGCGCALLGLAVGGSPPPGGHSLVGQADTLPGAPLPREAQKVTSNLVLKDEQGFVSQDRARTKALEAGGQAADPRVAEPGGLAPRPGQSRGPAIVGRRGHAIHGASASPHGAEGPTPAECSALHPFPLLLPPWAPKPAAGPGLRRYGARGRGLL